MSTMEPYTTEQPGMMQPVMTQPDVMNPGMMNPSMMQPGMFPGMMQPDQQSLMIFGFGNPFFNFFNPFCLFGPFFSPFCNMFMNPFVPPPPQFCSGFYYTVQPGDTLFTIANRFGVSLNALIAANPQITNPNVIFPGQIICVPSRLVPPPPATCSGFFYTVRPGDTLFMIAQRFGITLDMLIDANPQIQGPNFVIFPGQVICIPVTTGQIPPPPATCSGFFYTVRPGDTLFMIAQRFGVTLNALIAANPQITNPNVIFPGQIICVPKSVGFPPPPATCTGFYYTVQAGDTLFTIAQRFGVSLSALEAANPQITNPDVIFPGQVICVPRA